MSSVDMLRGVAALGVFLFHAGSASGFPKRALPPFELFGHTFGNIPSFLSFGASGVSLFFVISGFCLSLRPLHSGVVPTRNYYLGRAARVYPAYFVAVVFSLLIAIVRPIPWSIPEALGLFGFAQGVVQQWHLTINGALWSMSTEVQFYLVFPALFAAYALFGLRALVLTLAAALAFRFAVTLLPSAYVSAGGIVRSTFLMNSLAGRVCEFMAGIALASLWNHDRLRLASHARMLIVPALVTGLATRFYGPTWLADPVLGLMWAVVVGFTVTHIDVAQTSISAGFGRMSYSFFLIHCPVIDFTVDRIGSLVDNPWPRLFMVAGLTFPVCLVLSAWLYRYVEMPSHTYLRARWLVPMRG